MSFCWVVVRFIGKRVNGLCGSSLTVWLLDGGGEKSMRRQKGSQEGGVG